MNTMAVLLASGFEHLESSNPARFLEQHGIHAETIGISGNVVRSWNLRTWADKISVDRVVTDASVGDYCGLLIPDGILHVDALRASPAALEFVQNFFSLNRLVVALGYAPQVLISANRVKGRRLTSNPAIRVDLQNAGADWADLQLVVDQDQLITTKSTMNPAALSDFIVHCLLGVNQREQLVAANH